MFGAIFFAIWGCAVTTVTMVVGLNMLTEVQDMQAVQPVAVLPPVYSQPQLLVAPVVSGKAMKGYMFSNVSLEMDAAVLSKVSLPMEMVLQDGYLALVVGNSEFSFPEASYFQLLKFRSGLKRKINELVGDELVRDIYVSGVNFLGSKEARRKQTLRSVWLQQPDDSPPPPEPKKNDEH